MHVEGYKGREFLTDQETVAYFMAALDDAGRIALSPRESRDFILRLAESWSER
nr:Scr1 family TA system antitoxin-like transcriptional regulator [Nocardia zapadnayensis]